MNTIVIEVFKTNVNEAAQALYLETILTQYYPDSRITFDLEDCDKVLRIEGESICNKTVSNILLANGFYCSELE